MVYFIKYEIIFIIIISLNSIVQKLSFAKYITKVK